MNTTPSHGSMHLIKITSGINQYFYIVLLVAGIFFAGSTIFTLMRTAGMAASMNPFPTIILLFTILFVTVQSLLAYGLIMARNWVHYLLLIHSASLLIMGGIVLPLFQWTELIQPTLTSGIGIFVLTGIVTTKRDALITTARSLIPVVLYTLALGVIAVLSVIIRL